jgi:enoyl-CoA hydratase/carnithine racemase
MTALIGSKLDARTFRDLILTGARVGGEEARERGIVDEAVPGPDVLPRAIARAQVLAGKDRTTYGALKRGLFAETLAVLDGKR